MHYSGPTALGLSLADVSSSTFIDPTKNENSGIYATFVYTTDRAHLGFGDDQIVLDMAPDNSPWGQAYVTSEQSGGPFLKVGNLGATRVNDFETVVRFGNVMVNISTTRTLSDAQWSTLVASLRGA